MRSLHQHMALDRSKCVRRGRPLHNGSLKEVERKKKEAKELKMAQQRGFSSEVVQSLAQQFLSLVRCHSRLKRSSNAR